MEYKELTQLCKEARLNKNMTLEQVGKEIGCKTANICSFEHGRFYGGKVLFWYINNTDVVCRILEHIGCGAD